ncbi:asparagine synthetase B family protein [Dyella flava]|uniref:asparagine synthetase B family protein n=1 Tax=Dyella flava TaxID=1920170 RepID=UPI0019573EBD|nr:asparagine synthase-related protein [Dyella flava]
MATDLQSLSTPAGPLHLWAAHHDGSDHPGPGTLASSRNWIIFDGVLYNRAELDEWIGDARVDSDALRVLFLFERGDVEGFARLTGMFAFVIWDGEHKRLHAVRDRFGMKPLYVYWHGKGIAFASEMKQFFALPDSQSRLDHDACFDFLVSGLTDHGERTLFADVQRIPAGARLELDMNEWRPGAALPACRRWYELPPAGSLVLDEPSAAEGFRGLFMQAVSSQWRETGPRGLCLSGGLDSSAIAGVLALNHGDDALVTFKACFGDPVYDEPELLRSVLARCRGSSHVTHTGPLDPFRVMDRLVWHMDEPFGRASLAAQWMLFELAASHGIRATLDGQGADEQLCGYMSMVQEHRLFMAGESVADAHGDMSSRSSLQFHGHATGFGCFVSAWRERLNARFSRAIIGAKSLGELCRERMFHGDLPMMMRHNDRIGAAHGIQTHVPFMDHRLVEYSIALGNLHKLRGDETKLLLRRALHDVLPQALLDHRGKGSYSALEATWLRGEGRAALRSAVLDTVRDWTQLFSEAGIILALTPPAVDDKEQLMLLWRIACFGCWARRFDVSY